MAPKLSLRSGSGCGLAGREAFSLMEGIDSFLWFEVRDQRRNCRCGVSSEDFWGCHIKAVRLLGVAGKLCPGLYYSCQARMSSLGWLSARTGLLKRCSANRSMALQSRFLLWFVWVMEHDRQL